MQYVKAHRPSLGFPSPAAILLVALSLLTTAARSADIAPYSASAAPDWTALFDRNEGWTGADGVYAIPMSGNERPGSAARETTLWWFSDTFVGSVRPDGSRLNTTLVNNTTAQLRGDKPDAAKMRFHVREDSAGQAEAMVLPKQGRNPGQWFWPTDGIATDGKVYMFGMRVQTADTPPFSFATAGSSLLAALATDPAPFLGRYAQRDAPLFVPASDTERETYFGLALMPLTSTAGAPFPDGYLYIYGARNGTYVKSLVVARVLPASIDDFGAYRFWNGAAWDADIHRAASLTSAVSAEFSVSPLADGRFLLVHMTDLLGSTVAVRYGSSPVGPWGKDIPIWDCPEISLTPHIFVYGAKAHPHLSQQGQLLISYHVNTFDFAENFGPGGVDIYRPRFITVPLPQ